MEMLSVGDFVCYCSKPSLTVTEKVGIIVSARKECVWIGIEGGKNISRHKNNIKLHKTFNELKKTILIIFLCFYYQLTFSLA